MNYEQAVSYILSHAPTFQQAGTTAYKEGLQGIIQLMEHTFGTTRLPYPTIHIAGTNGKGTTASALASILQEAGLNVGLYTSPHIHTFRERIRVNRRMIPKQAVAHYINTHQATIDQLHPSFFEITTALAFNYFAQQQVDIAVIETGLGGHLDSTNIITPILSVITNVSYDHTYILGNTLHDIAIQKAGIIKPNTPVIIGQTHPETAPVFIQAAKENNAQILFADSLHSSLFTLHETPSVQGVCVHC